MKRIPGSGLSVLVSFAIGAGAAGYAVSNYEAPTKPATQVVRTVGDTNSPTPTPTYDMTPPGVEATPTPTVEGDDGSLGGPVYDQNHQSTSSPNYVYSSPNAVTPNDVTPTDSSTPTATPTETTAPMGQGGPDPVPSATEAPITAAPTPSHDDHATGAPSDNPTTG